MCFNKECEGGKAWEVGGGRVIIKSLEVLYKEGLIVLRALLHYKAFFPLNSNNNTPHPLYLYLV